MNKLAEMLLGCKAFPWGRHQPQHVLPLQFCIHSWPNSWFGTVLQATTCTYPFAVLGDEKQRVHLAADAEQPRHVLVVDSWEQIQFAVELGLVDVVVRQQRLHQNQRLRLAAADAERLRQEHVAVEALSCSTVSTQQMPDFQATLYQWTQKQPWLSGYGAGLFSPANLRSTMTMTLV